MSTVLSCAFLPELLNFYLFLTLYALGLCLAMLYLVLLFHSSLLFILLLLLP